MPLSLFAPLDSLFAPAPMPKRVAFLKAQPFAHRGLHGGVTIENSRAAFAAAMAKGQGFEFDVQVSSDHEAFVFHDDELDRLTGEHGAFAARSGQQIEQICLTGTEETIPRLTEILRLVDGAVPILIELKSDSHHVAPICLAVRRALEGYRGPFAVMSFNPFVVRWFHDHAERMVRGLVVTERDASGQKGLRQAIQRRLFLWRAKPNFLAYDIRDLPSRFAGAQRKRGLPILTWTVRGAAQERLAMAYADEVIYEKPAPPRP
jgi:glycerophosphoryl diester phosphodiesterase